jgi:endonuclease YncB( thermonuclease family)
MGTKFLMNEHFQWENQARVRGTGLWALPDPEKPWEWRKKKRIGTV